VHPSTPSAPPGKAIKESILGHFLLCQEDLEVELVVLDCLLVATTKKVRQLFQEKSEPSFESDK